MKQLNTLLALMLMAGCVSAVWVTPAPTWSLQQNVDGVTTNYGTFTFKNGGIQLSDDEVIQGTLYAEIENYKLDDPKEDIVCTPTYCNMTITRKSSVYNLQIFNQYSKATFSYKNTMPTLEKRVMYWYLNTTSSLDMEKTKTNEKVFNNKMVFDVSDMDKQLIDAKKVLDKVETKTDGVKVSTVLMDISPNEEIVIDPYWGNPTSVVSFLQSEHASYPAANVVDNDTSTYWRYAAASSGYWTVTLDMGTTHNVTGLRLYTKGDRTDGAACKLYEFYVCNVSACNQGEPDLIDGLWSYSAEGSEDGWFSYQLAAPVLGRYVKFANGGTWDSNTCGAYALDDGISELQVNVTIPNGASCTDDGECLSGFCTDNVCCIEACDGVCEACNVTGNVGSCAFIPVDTDPDNECDIGSDCATGLCDGAGVCDFYTTGDGACPTCQTCVGAVDTGCLNNTNNTQDTTSPNTCTSTCKKCMAGSCVAQDEDEDLFGQCGVIQCDSDPYYYFGWDALTCYYRADVSAAVAECDTDSICKTAIDYCGSQAAGDSTGISCSCVEAQTECTGTTTGSCDEESCPATTTTTTIATTTTTLAMQAISPCLEYMRTTDFKEAYKCLYIGQNFQREDGSPTMGYWFYLFVFGGFTLMMYLATRKIGVAGFTLLFFMGVFGSSFPPEANATYWAVVVAAVAVTIYDLFKND